MAQYCSSGFRPWPSCIDWTPRPTANTRNGGSMKAFRVRKKIWVNCSVATTHDIMSRWRLRLVQTTTAEYRLSSQLHSSSEPSWPPHQAPNLYWTCMARLECATT